MIPRTPGRPEDALLDDHVRAGGNDIDVVGLHGQSVRGLLHLHAAGAGQCRRQHAGLVGCQVLDDDEGHAGIPGKYARGRAHAHHRKRAGGHGAHRRDNAVGWRLAGGLRVDVHGLLRPMDVHVHGASSVVGCGTVTPCAGRAA